MIDSILSIVNKTCNVCQIELPIENFHKMSSSPDGKQYTCKSCKREKGIQYEKENSLLRRCQMLRRRYGITHDIYMEMEKKQLGKCKICHSNKRNGSKKWLDVDHCHKTGRVRGLLCNQCNQALGLLKDCPDRLIRIQEYLNDI